MAGFTHASPATIFGAILIHIAANNKRFYFPLCYIAEIRK
jgi:hypothetical protein